MEHKLAEFRARRAARHDGGAVCLSKTPDPVLSDGGGEAETAAASRQTEELRKSTSATPRDSTQAAVRQLLMSVYVCELIAIWLFSVFTETDWRCELTGSRYLGPG